MISIVTWLWKNTDYSTAHNAGDRIFTMRHVNVLRAMFSRHLRAPHRVILITDEDTKGLDRRVEAIPTPRAAVNVAHLGSPEGAGMPSCYRRLWTFSNEARSLGPRILSMDLDVALVNDVTPLVEREESFVGWRPIQPWGNGANVCGGVFLLTTGAHREVWDDFSVAGVREAHGAGFRGSDQAWISFKIGATCARWKREEGIYSYKEMKRFRPVDARMVQFAGWPKPWQPEAQSIAWVRSNYHDREDF